MYYLSLLIYFFVGIVQDFLFTLNTKYVAKDKVFLAVVSSFLTVVVSMLVLYNILNDLDAEKSVISIIVYCFGIATGTFVAMKFKFGTKNGK